MTAIALRPSPLALITPAQRRVLDDWSDGVLGDRAQVIPKAERVAIADQLRAGLAGEPIGIDRARRAAIGLMACYPTNNIAVPEAWSSALAEEIAGECEFLVRQALRTVRRSLKFMPAVAEVVEALAIARDDAEILLDVLAQMDQHERGERFDPFQLMFVREGRRIMRGLK